MNRVMFDNISDLSNAMIEMYTNDESDFPIISAFAKYEIVKELLTDLVVKGLPLSMVVDLEDPEIGGYFDEYCLTIDNDGIWVEKCLEDGRYLWSEHTVAFVHDDCNSLILKHFESDLAFDFCLFEDEEHEEYYDCCECDCCCGECEHCEELEEGADEEYELVFSSDDGEPYGFTQSWSDNGSYYSRSFYSTDKAIVQQMLQEWKI